MMKRLSRKQKFFVRHLIILQNNTDPAPPDAHRRALSLAEVAGGYSNQADFIMRLLDRGVLELKVNYEAWGDQR